MIRLLRRIMAQLAHLLALAASERRKLVARLCYDVAFGPQVRVDRGVLLVTRQGGRIRIGGNTHIWPGAILDARGGVIEIGVNGLINAGSYIVAGERVTIGREALIAEYVTIRDTDHAAHDPHVPMRDQGRVTSPVTIGDNVWLAAKVTVTKGVTIGAGAIVGANAVVTRDLAAGGRYGGVPARPLGGGSSNEDT